MRFAKMHGLGNDYIYVDTARERIDDPASLAREVSDRSRGIGADGLILIGPSRAHGAHVEMRIFNADGSEAQMCGNGIRCVAKYVIDRALATANPLRIETRRGVLAARWERGDDGFVASVEVDMGVPQLAARGLPAEIPGVAAGDEVIARLFSTPDWDAALRAHGSVVDTEWIEPAGLAPTITLVSMGNPHAVFWVDSLGAVPMAAAGAAIERHEWFPERINVHFVQKLSASEVRVKTWERGSGATQACGTGASAVCVAGVLEGHTERRLVAHLPGGALELSWPEPHGSVFMTGPATHVFDGEWPARVSAGAGL